MSDKKYCYEKVAPRGSALYFSLRTLTDAQRDQVVAVYAFYHEIEEIIFECQDYQLALIKFNWWRDEVARLMSGAVDHPVLKFLLRCDVKDLQSAQQRFFAIIDGFEQAVVPAPFANFEEVVVHYMRTAGERELLLQTLLGVAIEKEKLFHMMLVIERVNYLQHLRRYARRQLIYFADDEMAQFGVQAGDFMAFQTTPAIKKFLQYEAEKIIRVSEWSDAESFWLVRCEMAKKILRAIGESDYKVLENFITLTPLRLWWIAWWG